MQQPSVINRNRKLSCHYITYYEITSATPVYALKNRKKRALTKLIVDEKYKMQCMQLKKNQKHTKE